MQPRINDATLRAMMKALGLSIKKCSEKFECNEALMNYAYRSEGPKGFLAQRKMLEDYLEKEYNSQQKAINKSLGGK